LKLLRIERENFRNLKSQQVDFQKQVTVLTGKNGQGKTSLLESIYVLSHSKSFRTARPSEMVNWDSEKDCSLKAIVESEEGEKEVVWRVVSGKREMLVNGSRVTASSGFYGNLKCVEFTPDDLTLVSGSPGERRKFFDRLISQTSESYFENLLAYHRALKQRNSLILRGENNPSVFIPWNEIMADKGLFVAEQRSNFTSEFSKFFSSNYSYFTGYEQSKVGIESAQLKYASRFIDDEGKALAKEEVMAELASRLSQDISRRTSLYGIHRDDFEIYLDTGSGSRQAKKSASQGQKRSISLALKFAAVNLIEKITGDRPVVLLDDVESELDRFRKQALFGKIAELGGQVVITATELNGENRRNLSSPEVFQIENGLVGPGH